MQTKSLKISRKEKKAIGERIIKVRDLLGYSTEEFAAVLGTTRHNLYNYKSGLAEPNSKIYKSLIRLGVNLHWLLTGEGEPFTTATSSEDFIPVPLLDAVAGAGTTGGVQSDDVQETFYLPKNFLKRLAVGKTAELYFLRASGDSMEPTISPEDLLIVQRHRPGDRRISGAIYILRKNDELLVKRIDFYHNKIVLRSDNEKIQSDEISESEFAEIEIIARVLATIKPL